MPEDPDMETNDSAKFNGITENTISPRFIRTSDIQGLYGLKRSFVYQLIKDGRLKSISLKGRAGIRGIRLFRPEDIEAVIQDLSMEAKS